MRVNSIEVLSQFDNVPNPSIGLFSYGTINPEVMRLVTQIEPIAELPITLRGVGLRFQPFEFIPPSVKEILEKSWGKDHIGAFTLVPAKEELVEGHLHFIPGYQLGTALRRLDFWNFYKLWYNPARLHTDNPSGHIITDVIGNPNEANRQDLIAVPEGIFQSPEFANHMAFMENLARKNRSDLAAII